MTKEQLHQQKLNDIFDQTRENFTGLLHGLTEEEMIDKAKEKADSGITFCPPSPLAPWIRLCNIFEVHSGRRT